MNISQRTLNFAGRTVTLCALLAAGTALAGAQETSTATPEQTPHTLNLQLPADDSNYSSSDTGQIAVAENHMDFVSTLNSMQPPPRYGGRRPRYRGGNTNPDGSNKYAFVAGAGLAQPVGNTYHYFTPSYAFQVGVGRNFSNQFATLLQFDYDRFGINGRTLSTFSYVISGDPNPNDYGFDGHAHDWSFTINPVYNLTPKSEGLGAYVVAGAGFYHKVTNFTLPQQGTYCDIYGFCYSYTANSTFPGGSYVSNAPGFNGGFGLTYKVSRFSNERLYAEVRYVATLNTQRQGGTTANAATYTGFNFFPANSNRTTYVPVKFGVRF